MCKVPRGRLRRRERREGRLKSVPRKSPQAISRSRNSPLPQTSKDKSYLLPFWHILSRGGKDMKTDTDNRAVILGRYIADTGATVRQCAKEFGISKSTVHTDVTERLYNIDRALQEKVRRVLEKNKTERHLRGGEATRKKFEAYKKGSQL